MQLPQRSASCAILTVLLAALIPVSVHAENGAMPPAPDIGTMPVTQHPAHNNPISFNLQVRDPNGIVDIVGVTAENGKWLHSATVEHSTVSPVAPVAPGIGIGETNRGGTLTLYSSTYRTGIDVVVRPGKIDTDGNVPMRLEISDAILRALKKRTLNGVPYEEPDVVTTQLMTESLIIPGKPHSFDIDCDRSNADACVKITLTLAVNHGDSTDHRAQVNSGGQDGELLVNANVLTAPTLAHAGDTCPVNGQLYRGDLDVMYCDHNKVVNR